VSRWAFGPAVMTVVLAIACGGSPTPAATALNGPPVALGVEVDLSGPYAQNGRPYAAGAQTYISWLNDNGGINGSRAVLTTLDDQGKADLSVTNAKQLAQGKSVGIIGSTTSVTQIPSQAVYEGSDVPIIVFAPTDQLLTGHDFFAIGVSATSSYSIQANFCKQLMAKQNKTAAKVAFFHIDTPAQTANVKVTTTLVQSWGWTVAGDFKYSASSTDVAPVVLQMSQSKPDCVVGAVLDNVLPTTLNAMQQYGITAPFVNFFAGNAEASFRAIHNSQFYALRDAADPSDPSPAGYKAMLAAAKKYGTQNQMTSNLFTKGYVAAEAFAAAIKKCGPSCDGPAVRKSLEALSLPTQGFTADIKWTPTNHVLSSGRIYQWSDKDQRSVAVTPDIAAS
jgi:ABC-type branched-subunit amino acid transport system substrate-binding protein